MIIFIYGCLSNKKQTQRALMTLPIRLRGQNNEWPATLTKQAIRNLAMLAPKVFFDKNKLAWIRLEDHNYPRTALWLPERYRKEALCETHDSIFAGHNAALKSYLKLTTSYFWPTVYSHVLKHTQTCLRCQQRKTGKKKNQPLAPLPIPDMPNTRIHADLFGPMVDASRKSAYILCITDAFTKYAVVTTIQNKDAQTVAKAIFEQWFCKFGIPAQIHTDGGKEFVNKLLGELCELLNVQHTKTTPYHPQCNSQVEVFNKTVKKYLASYVDETTLNWDEFLPALMLAYNTSYHSTIATTPFVSVMCDRIDVAGFENVWEKWCLGFVPVDVTIRKCLLYLIVYEISTGDV